MSQAELGGGELSASYISLLENGKRVPTDEAIVKIAARLGISTGELVGNTGVSTPEVPSEPALETTFMLRRARLALLTGDCDGALTRFAKAAEDAARHEGAASENLEEALFGRAETLERAARLTEAADLFREWLDAFTGPETDCVRQLDASMHLLRCRRETTGSTDDADAAEQLLTFADTLGLSDTPAGVELAGLVAEFRWERRLEGSAIELLDRAAAVADAMPGPVEQAHSYAKAADAAHEGGRLPYAVAFAERAIDACHGGQAVRLARMRIAEATVRHRLGATTGAEPAGLRPYLAELSARGTPGDVAAGEAALARRLLDAGDAEGARDTATSAVRRVGESWRRTRAYALLALGNAMWALGDRRAPGCFEEAGRELGGLLGMNQQSASAYLELAQLFERAGDVKAALSYYRRASAAAGLLPSDEPA